MTNAPPPESRKPSLDIPPLYQEWRPMIDLIPRMQSAVNSCMHSHHKHHTNHGHLQNELDQLRPGIDLFQGKYTLDIIFILNGQESLYFNEIKAALPYINTGTLIKRLKELEENGVITREVHQGQPVRVSYGATILGQGIFQLLLPLLVYTRFHKDLEKFFDSRSNSKKGS